MQLHRVISVPHESVGRLGGPLEPAGRMPRVGFGPLPTCRRAANRGSCRVQQPLLPSPAPPHRHRAGGPPPLAAGTQRPTTSLSPNDRRTPCCRSPAESSFCRSVLSCVWVFLSPLCPFLFLGPPLLALYCPVPRSFLRSALSCPLRGCSSPCSVLYCSISYLTAIQYFTYFATVVS